jgi:hypothetical protein
MRTSLKWKITVAILGTILLLSVILNAYLIRDDAGGTVLWNAQEAYCFIGVTTLGRRVKWIQYPLVVALEWLGNIGPPDDAGSSLIVIHISSSGVERHTLDLPDRRPGSGPGFFTPKGGRIWANWPTIGGLCWWAGDHFEPAPEEQQRASGGIGGLTKKDFDAGWSEDGVAAQGENHFESKVGEEFDLSVAGWARAPDGRSGISINMRTPGHPPRSVLELNSRNGLVSRSEYRRAFRNTE